MVKRSNSHVWVGLGFVAFAIAVAGAAYLGMKWGGGNKPATQASPEASQAAPMQAQPLRPAPSAVPQSSQATESTPPEQSQELSFNAIGPYVNKEAGYVCEGERWVLQLAESDAIDNHIIWQGENGEQRAFTYRWTGTEIYLTDTATGKKTSFPMVHLNNGDWLLKGKRLQECAG